MIDAAARHGVVLQIVSASAGRPPQGDVVDGFALLDDSAATLHLVGREDVDRRYTRKVRARLATPRLRERVIAHGPVDQSAIGGFLAGADAFVALSGVEAYGTAGAEALAA